MTYDYEILRARREQLEKSLTRFAEKFGLDKAMVSRIERGIGVRSETLQRYLSCLDLSIEDVEIVAPLQRFSEPSFSPPTHVLFRPFLWPNERSSKWKDSQTTITFSGWRMHPGELGSRVDSIEFSLVFPDFYKHERVRFKWRYWVAIDGSLITEEDDPDPNSRWRGEISPFGYGSSVQPHVLNPGQVLSSEVMFFPASKLPWRAFSATLTPELIEKQEKYNFRFEVRILWFERHGSLSKSAVFNVPVKCLNRGFVACSTNKFKLAQFLQLRTIEGGEDACAHDCC